jgi:hypothetical protein
LPCRLPAASYRASGLVQWVNTARDDRGKPAMSEPPPKADANSSRCGMPGHGVCQPAQCRVNRVNRVNLVFEELRLAALCAAAPRDAFQRQEGPAKPSTTLLNSLELSQQ